MVLWSIQPEELYYEILNTGVYRCDISKSFMNDDLEAYDWLRTEMVKKIGPMPEGVSYPVWAWYVQDKQRKKPDLRRERWCYGSTGDRFACIEIEVPDEEVVLTDFDEWSIILLHSLISYTEEEDEALEAEYNSLSAEKQLEMKYNNWKRVFEISPMDTEWTIRGRDIQATFWELKKEYIRDVRFFTAG